MNFFVAALKFLAVLLLFVSNVSFASPLDDAELFRKEKVVRYCGAHPSKDNCDDGDSMIFSGLLCLSGEESGCESVKASQDAEGRFWRSPRRNPGNLGEGKTFSRDQALGALLYIAKKRDVEAATRWWNWIEKNKNCVAKPRWLGGGCVVTTYRFCKDSGNDACNMTPAILSVFHRTWTYLGLNPTGPMRDFEGADVGDIEIESARSTESGYQLHLKAVSSLLRLHMRSSTSRSFEIVSILSQRQPNNPFYKLIAEGPTVDVEAKILELCPKTTDNLEFERFQWSWERADSNEAWRQSMGWECVFMSKLLRDYDTVLPRR